MPADLRSITDFDSLLEYLANELDWPIENYTREQLTFEYDAEDLGLKEEEVAKLSHGSIQQLRPLQGQQPFGIFFVEFDHAKLPIVVLRRILSQLVIKKRSSANSAEAKRWDVSDLIFISAFGEEDHRELAFAHFHKDPETTELPVLRVLGWHGEDTQLKSDAVARTLKNRLSWPENEADQEAWRQQWRSAFKHKPGHTIRTAKELATAMAGFAKRIRDAARDVLPYESESGRLRKLYKGFQDALIHDLSEDDFTTYYAETICYGLFTVAVSKTELSEGKYGTAVAVDDVAHFVPVTNPFLKEMLWSFLEAGGRNKELNFDDLGINEIVSFFNSTETDLPAVIRDFGSKRPGEDPVIHLYEDFLKQFDADLRKQRGVYYTPKPVVSYIIRSIHELLQSEFDIEDGLASTLTWGDMQSKDPALKLPPLTDLPGEERTIPPDEPFVQILDPATGTATFLVEVIEQIAFTVKSKWGTQFGLKIPANREAIVAWQESKILAKWNEYVPKHLLPRLHGYELMMAPYAIAHMKIGLKLAETGYRFGSGERARIFLTNALEPWVKQLPLVGIEALAQEAAAVNEIKRHKRFTVIVGNPPYSGVSANNSQTAIRLVDAYKFVDGVPLGERKHWLQDDYKKFVRIAELKIKNTGVGIVGYITNHGYLEEPTSRGMRRSLMISFPNIYQLDAHGSLKKREVCPDGATDQNVFDIEPGVSIGLFLKKGSKDSENILKHAHLWGLRTEKLDFLANHQLNNTDWVAITPKPRFYLFTPSDSSLALEYEKYTMLVDAFSLSTVGCVTARDGLTIHWNADDVWETVTDFASLPEEVARTRYDLGNDVRDWSVEGAQRDVRASGPTKSLVAPVLYRPFDQRFTYYTGQSRGFIGQPQPNVMRQFLRGPNLGLSIGRQGQAADADEWNVVFCTKFFTEFNLFRRGGNNLNPLYSYPPENDAQQQLASLPVRSPNLKPSFLKALATRLGIRQEGEYGLPAGITPEDIFHYAYAVFYSPGFRSRYADFLKIDFPRLPLPGSLELFKALARHGSELTAFHLLEAPMLDAPVAVFVGDSSAVIGRVGWSYENGGTVWIDSAHNVSNSEDSGNISDRPGTSGFSGVLEVVYRFRIGGYQVCHKWLKDRKGRILTCEDIAHYKNIVIAISETIRLMEEIDDSIDMHGGWPGAFQITHKD